MMQSSGRDGPSIYIGSNHLQGQSTVVGCRSRLRWTSGAASRGSREQWSGPSSGVGSVFLQRRGRWALLTITRQMTQAAANGTEDWRVGEYDRLPEATASDANPDSAGELLRYVEEDADPRRVGSSEA